MNSEQESMKTLEPIMKTLEQMEDNDYGYQHGRCPRCQHSVWSDSGEFSCESCGFNEEEERMAADNERMRAACVCEWDPKGQSYFWNPRCSEHTEPQDACDDEWALWFKGYCHSRGMERFRTIAALLTGLHTIGHVMSHRGDAFLQKRIDIEELGSSYRVLIPLESAFRDEILAAAREK